MPGATRARGRRRMGLAPAPTIAATGPDASAPSAGERGLGPAWRRDVTTRPSPSDVRPDRSTLLAFAGVVVLGGGNAIAVKQSVRELAPFWSAGLRFAVAALLLLAIVVVARRPFPGGRSLAGGLLYGIVAFAASFAFVYPALREVSAGTAIVFLALVPLMTFGLAVIHGQERFQVQGLLGALIALGGVAVRINDPACVAKTFPGYFASLARISEYA